MTDMLIEFKGLNGQIELYTDKIIIKRKGTRAKLTQGFFKGDKTIYIKQITGIQLKEAGLFIGGYIQFTIPGGIESRRGISDANRDENTVMFLKTENKLAQQMKSEIEKLMMNSTQPLIVNNKSNDPDLIRNYKQLLDEGIITQEEFEAKKKEILGN
jgi:Short C-terminal domain/Domain of unknown function (DUF4429)